jgi:adenosine deaminase
VHVRIAAWLAAVVAALAVAAPAVADERGAARTLRRIADEPVRLNQFLWEMPKGADLHMHLSGAVYAEEMLRYGAADGDCVDLFTFVSSPSPCEPGERPLSDALGNNELQNAVMRAWSMKGFEPGVQSGHDHFFAAFGKFGAALDGHNGDGLATVARRARAQTVQYLEVLQTPRFGDVSALAAEVGFTRDLAAMRRRLLAAGIRSIVPLARRDLDELLAQERAADPSPRPLIRFDVQVLRAMPPAVVFAQMLLGFELMRADPRWVGLNLVQPEDDNTALRDYALQMRMIRFLRGIYRSAKVTLHAGELMPGLAPPRDLRFHIRAAVHVAGAERIGHGVDIRHERNPIALLREMARDDILVETPLVSNCQILEVCGGEHPIELYRRFGVPVALATDDEGVSRTDLTEQYERAVRVHGLGYRALKQIANDSLRHAFLPRRTRLRLLRRQQREFRRFERGFP